MMCVALKEFTAGGEDIIRNQLVDGEQFRNLPVLISQRFIRPATEREIASARFEDEPAPTPRKTSGLKVRVAKRRH